jgi:hypothetical protein
MFISFEAMQPSSRLWIYQSNRKFTTQEEAIIASQLQLFTERWAAHGHPLKTSFSIREHQFILLAADESHESASGCSIDDSVRTIQELGNQVGVDLFNRNLVAFKSANDIVLIPLTELKQAYHQGTWNEAALTFNNLIQTCGQIETEWIVPAGKTWLKRYVPAEKVAP